MAIASCKAENIPNPELENSSTIIQAVAEPRIKSNTVSGSPWPTIPLVNRSPLKQEPPLMKPVKPKTPEAPVLQKPVSNQDHCCTLL